MSAAYGVTLPTDCLGLPDGYTLQRLSWSADIGMADQYVLGNGASRYVQWPVEDGLDYDRVLKHAVACLERASGRDQVG